MEQAFLDEITREIGELQDRSNVTELTAGDAKARAEAFGTRTVYGNFNFVSNVKTLSTALTVYLGSGRVESGVYTQKKKDIRKNAAATIRAANQYLQKAPLAFIRCGMGEESDFTPACNFYVSTYRAEMVRLAHMVSSILFPPREGNGPELTVICIPEWQEKDRQILVLPEIGVTYILGSDHFGEVKNAFLRMAVWYAKERRMLGLHAASQVAYARSPQGKLRKLGLIIFGIAATGKTTHSCHNHELNMPGEGVEIVQDDVVFWRPDGSALGSERGFYIKTEALTPEDQPLLYYSSLNRDSILYNVMVDYQGNTYFTDRTLTPNGRGIIQRSSLGAYASESINLPPLEELDGLVMAFMVRNYTVVPIASKLTPEQAAVAYTLSESIDAAASDMQKTIGGGISANPFIIGDVADEINRFYELVRAHQDKVECYMLNTGGVGEWVETGLDGARKVKKKVTRVEISEMAAVIRGICRGTIRWREDPNWMAETPEYVDGLDITRFELDQHYDQHRIDATIASVRVERAALLEQIKGLDPAIRGTVEF